MNPCAEAKRRRTRNPVTSDSDYWFQVLYPSAYDLAPE
jgi:hypothetical protein